MSVRISFLISYIASLLATQSAHALQVSPMTVTLAPSGPEAGHALELANAFDEPIAVTLAMAEREVDEHGHEAFRKTAEVARQFVVFPAQLTLKARERRLVRVLWKGESELSSERSYRLIVEQLPISGQRAAEEIKKKKAMVNLLLKYLAAIYVRPPGAKPQIEVELNGNLLKVRNRGGAHQLLRNFWIEWDGGRVRGAELPSVMGQNVLAGHERVFEFSKFTPDVTSRLRRAKGKVLIRFEP